MALERKDVRFKLDAEWHAALTLVAERDGCDIGEWVEQVVLPKVKKRIEDATVLADAAARLGISGKSGESPGARRNKGGEHAG